jgi:hypothetical protein
MTAEQLRAYEWAINQNYQSVAAQYARTLAAALDAANARADKAVGDMNVMALAMRESEELSEGCCFACIYDGQNLPDNAILPYGECPGYERDDCFEWRGDAAEEDT